MAEKKEYLWGYTPRREKFGKGTVGTLARVLGRVRSYGHENVPMEGGIVLAFNHFSMIDPPAFGGFCPRRCYFLAKSEVMSVPGLSQFLSLFGTFQVRRGESDREAVRRMREVVRAGEALGVFIEGTRQNSGELGEAMPGAAMVALREGVPVLPAAVRGSESWKGWNFHPVTLAWSRPMSFPGIPANSKGYHEVTTEIANEIHRLWEWLGEVQAQGRPRGLTVPPRD